MASNDTSPSERISAFYKRLSVSAAELNAVSDELGKSISVLDDALKKLNLGISAWVRFAGYEDENDSYWSRNLGYAKINGKWGFAINERSGNHNIPEEEDYESWLFNDAPRALRIEAVEKLPDLLEKLIQEADKTIEKTKSRAIEARELATAVTQLVQPQKRKQ